MNSESFHVPVLIEPVIALAPREGLFIDGTLGDGGHTLALINERPQARVIGIDRDPRSLQRAATRIKERASFITGSYADILTLISKDDLNKVNFVLLDLGYSSAQMNDAKRGFSFMNDGILDMRYSQDEMTLTTAAELVNRASPAELERILKEYGEEWQAKKIVRYIVEARRKQPIKTTRGLTEIIEQAIPYNRKLKIHPATKTFQALRIAVNNELEEVRYFVTTVVPSLPVGCIVAVITFHSLEDRIVKRGFKELYKPSKNEFGEEITPKAVALYKKVIVPSSEEIKTNPRARSAKLRAIKIL